MPRTPTPTKHPKIDAALATAWQLLHQSEQSANAAREYALAAMRIINRHRGGPALLGKARYERSRRFMEKVRALRRANQQ